MYTSFLLYTLFSAFPVRSHHYSTRSCVSNKSTSSKSGRLQDRRFESNRVESSRFDQLFCPSCVANRLPVSRIDYNTDDSSRIESIRPIFLPFLCHKSTSCLSNRLQHRRFESNRHYFRRIDSI